MIANPPYVRQEIIADPLHSESEVSKKQYKEKLLRQMQLDWNDERGELIQLSKKSDLYIYFFLKGLKLLSKDGVMCFISSNSWLDVEYGVAFQQILLKRVPIIGIYDNQVKRSFKHADVNTVISIFRAPRQKDWEPDVKENKVKFVIFRKPFEDVLFSEYLWNIENDASARTSEPEYRLVQMTQNELFEEGEEKVEDKLLGSYVGAKWGGMFLRAPDIFFAVLERARGKLIPLSKIADVRFGVKTGANEFFILDAQAVTKWQIESKYLKPIIVSPRECSSIMVNGKDLTNKIFICHDDRKNLAGTKALKYIQWGESKGFHLRPSCAGRAKWWDIGNEINDVVAIAERYQQRFFFLYNPEHLILNKSFSGVRGDWLTCCIGLSLITQLSAELFARTPGGGGGPLDLDVNVAERLLVINPEILSKKVISELRRLFQQIQNEKIERIEIELASDNNDTRQKINLLLAEALGLSKGEISELRDSTLSLYRERVSKAKTT